LKQASIRLHRKLLTPQPEAKPKSQQGILSPPPEPVEQTLLVGPDAAGRALDKEIRIGETYEYRAQRVARVTVGSKTMELAGPLSAPVRVEALDVFPPAVPTGLAAVSTAPSAGTEAAIDLSWQPDTEADLAGYIVYRREGSESWQRISPAPPLVGPAFHDALIQPGHTYRYAVTAIDQGGHESARSAEAEETVPSP
jgi:fibronectin type 3 domain-containing protein